MKNFSVKTADFDSLSISGESPIVQSDLGTAPNQIPLNKDLGSLAYMNAPQIEDINVDTLELREIAAELSDTAVDVFVYDTRKDSDGGAWRHRAQHTSWYNEELNTATRGGRREFPAVAVIVAEEDRVTICDGDDPDLGIWMVFDAGNENGDNMIGRISETTTSITMLNGLMCVGRRNFGLHMINFITDSARFKENEYDTPYNLPIGTNRNGGNGWLGMNVDGNDLVNDKVNDVAMTVLPDAPIDTETGLPVPTIAVATDGGVSVIRNDGSVESNGSFGKIQKVTIDNKHNLYIFRDMAEDYVVSYGFVGNEISNFTTEIGVYSFRNGKFHTSLTTNQFNLKFTRSDVVSGQDYGLLKVDTMAGNFDEELFSYITSKYNTGWMPGDIKLAALSDTKIEKVGVDETTELIVDGSDNWVGNFDVVADVSEWTGSGGTIDGSLGYVRITQTTNSTAYLTIPINTVVGKKYKISADIRTSVADTVNTGAAFYIGETAYQNDVALRRPMVSEGSFSSFSLEFVATTSVTHITLASWAQSGDHVEFDNVSVKQTGELITNGTFDDETVGWTEISDPTLTVTDNKLNLKCLNGDNQAGVWQNISANDPSQKYILSFDIGSFVGDTAANLMVSVNDYFDGAATTGNVEVFSGKENGIYSFGFNGRPAGVMIFFRIYDITGPCSGDTSINISNISVRLAEDDRSVNDNGLQVFGEIEKTPVAPGADLVAYSGFSANNYLMQPYNSDLDFGTGDFCVMGWFNTQQTSSNAYDDLLSIGDLGTVGYGAWSEGGLLIQNRTDSNRFLSYLATPSGQANVSLPQPYYTPNAWNHFVIKREAGLVSVFFNGVQEAAPVEYYYNFARNNNPNWKFTIGYSGDNYVYPANNSKLALLRISATAPTDEQIAKIYRDEKPLFTDGAQATLYGTSDAVTALAYDDSDNLLHVGTASGRSVFNGLKRVENTTTAVSTAISATEGLVIEQ